jgi:antitoxin component YwqK of YwqJK toxin-antitoxin module
MIKQLLFLLLVVFSISGSAQKDQMPKDADGRKHGEWERYHDNGKLRYTGRFEHGVEVDTFYFYFDNGSLRATNVFDSETPGLCYSQQFGQGEKLAAEGHYLNTKRSGEWVFYDAQGRVLSKEVFKDGLKEGTSIIYHENGEIAETLVYKSDKREGKWELYYESGNIKMKGTYANDLLQGPTYLFEAAGHLRAKGQYNKGLMAGRWKFYNAESELEYEEVWRAGKLISTTQEETDEKSPSPIQTIDELRKKYER